MKPTLSMRTGIIRLAIVIMVGTAAAICWSQAGAPYAQLQDQINALNLEATATWSGDLGTPVYYGPEAQPQELRLNIEPMGLAFVAEPKIKNDETVDCLRKYPNALVHVVDRPLSSVGPLLLGNSPIYQLPEHFVLFDSEKTADAVVLASSPAVLDFEALHPEPRLDACLTRAYMKMATQAKNSVSKARQDFFLSSASLLAEVLTGELAFFLLLYWVLRGFFQAERTT